MAKSKENVYVEQELQYLEMKLEHLKQFCDANPINQVEDRTITDIDPRGRHMTKVVATKEAQIKCIRESFLDCIKMVEAIARLREKEGVKKALTRGDQELTPMENGELHG